VLWFEVDPCRLNDELDALEKRDVATTASIVSGLLHIETRVVIVSFRGDTVTTRATVTCPDAFPSRAPSAFLPDFEVPPERIGTHRWHINHDGSVCFGDPSIWTAQMTLVEVLDKVSDWLTNYLALDAGVIEEMPASGTYTWTEGVAST
jgi:hypothetical protein